MRFKLSNLTHTSDNDEQEVTIQSPLASVVRINLFRFNCFCMMVCRDDNETKANLLHELLKYTNKAVYNTDFIDKKIGVTWNNSRLKDIIFFMTYLSEFMPKVWYNKTLFLAKRNRKEAVLAY